MHDTRGQIYPHAPHASLSMRVGRSDCHEFRLIASRSLFLLCQGLRGGIGDLDVGEFFLADSADSVGICE